jgi:hypothetical protein
LKVFTKAEDYDKKTTFSDIPADHEARVSYEERLT